MRSANRSGSVRGVLAAMILGWGCGTATYVRSNEPAQDGGTPFGSGPLGGGSGSVDSPSGAAGGAIPAGGWAGEGGGRAATSTLTDAQDGGDGFDGPAAGGDGNGTAGNGWAVVTGMGVGGASASEAGGEGGPVAGREGGGGSAGRDAGVADAGGSGGIASREGGRSGTGGTRGTGGAAGAPTVGRGGSGPGTGGRSSVDGGIEAGGAAPPPPDRGRYSFEPPYPGSGQPWRETTGRPAFASVGPSMSFAFLGAYSLAGALNATAANLYELSVGGALLPPPGATITFHVLVPPGSTVTWIKAFADLGPPTNARVGEMIPVGSLSVGDWIPLQVALSPAAGTVRYIGVQFNVAAPWAGSVFIDSVDW
jgi:hypothetical protein